MRVLIIDDERLARNELRRLLGAFGDIDVVAEAANVAEAVHAIEAMNPDLVLLDIHMPDGSGFNVLTALDRAPPAVIFTTAFDQYAVRAFDVNALDYLLKPVEPTRLAQALAKVRSATAPQVESDSALAPDGKIFIQDGPRCWFVALDQVALFESEGNYTRLYFDDERPLLLRSLNQLELRLDPRHFVRTSRRQIVNLRFVTDVGAAPGATLTLSLRGGLRITMSRRRATLFKQATRL